MTSRRTSGEVLSPTSEDDSKPHPLRSTLRNNTFRRCWGALKETVDALGAAWDAYGNDAGDAEANASCCSHPRPPPMPISPRRPSLGMLHTPPPRPLRESSNPHRSHYDTIANSPTASRSSRRKCKTNPRRSIVTPSRLRNPKGDIDHSYSTDEDGCGLHARVLNRLFHQGPPQALDDEVCVFACPQAGLMEKTKPDCHGKKRQTTVEPTVFKSSCTSLGRRMSTFSLSEIDRASMEKLRSDRSICDDFHLDVEDSVPSKPRATNGTTDSEPENHDDGTNREDSQQTMARRAGTAPISCPSIDNANPLRRLTERAASKIPSAKFDMEAWNRHVGSQGDIPNKGMLDRTLPTGPRSGTQTSCTESQAIEDARVQQQEMMDTWRGQVVPQKSFPIEVLLDGKRLPEPRFETRQRRWQRRAASCIILSVAVPSERNTIDLLTTPLDPQWGPKQDDEASSMSSSGPEETLMSIFGVSLDPGVADSHNEPTRVSSSADDVMSRSAAMGSMSKLDRTDAVARRLTETYSCLRLTFANDRNQWWHCVNNARAGSGSLAWTMMLDVCELPPDFQEEETKAPVNRCKDLYRMIYDFYGMHHGDGSNINIPQRRSIHNYYSWKLEQHTRGVWAIFMARWVTNIKVFPPANPTAAAAEAYTQIAIKDHPRSGSMFRRPESPANALSKYVTFMPKHTWWQKEDRMRFVVENGLWCFAQLVSVRCKALRFETHLVKHPEVVVPTQLP